jgi:DNA ligase 1
MSSPITRPMLAEKTFIEKLGELPYPLIGSPKLDGVRCLIVGGKARARKFTPIKNNHIRTSLEARLPDGLDGELMAGDTFHKCSGAVRSAKGTPAFRYWVFDFVPTDLAQPYEDRTAVLNRWYKEEASPEAREIVRIVPTRWILNLGELLAYEKEVLAEGFEGVIIRRPDAPYKCGRSTYKQAWMLKVKRFEDAECRIIGFEEMMHNTNEAEIDALGLTKRSKCCSGLVPSGTLGAFIVVALDPDGPFGTEPFRIGTGIGLTKDFRQEVFDNQAKYRGQIIKYRYQVEGTEAAPRIPSFQGIRNLDDMT